MEAALATAVEAIEVEVVAVAMARVRRVMVEAAHTRVRTQD